jgi:hypothetical protein
VFPNINRVTTRVLVMVLQQVKIPSQAVAVMECSGSSSCSAHCLTEIAKHSCSVLEVGQNTSGVYEFLFLLDLADITEQCNFLEEYSGTRTN